MLRLFQKYYLNTEHSSFGPLVLRKHVLWFITYTTFIGAHAVMFEDVIGFKGTEVLLAPNIDGELGE